MKPARALLGPLLLASGVTLLCGCVPDPVEDQHGIVRITLTRAQNVQDNPFVGTAQIRVVMDYEQCLQDFYLDNRPEYKQDSELGEPVFGSADLGGEGWADRLCDDPPAQQVPCSGVSIEQVLNENSNQLRVTYDVTSTDLETKYLPFGPIPLPELAQCEQGLQPRVSLTGSPVTGLDAQEGQVWVTVTFDTAEAVPDQGADLVVRVGPS